MNIKFKKLQIINYNYKHDYNIRLPIKKRKGLFIFSIIIFCTTLMNFNNCRSRKGGWPLCNTFFLKGNYILFYSNDMINFSVGLV